MINGEIIEEAKNTLFEIQQTTKEKFENAAETIKKVLAEAEQFGVQKPTLETPTGVLGTVEEAKKDETQQNGLAQETIESAKDKITVPKEEEFKPIQEKENFLKNRLYTYERLELPAATQKVTTVVESVFESSTTAKVVPVVCNGLKKIVK